MQFGISDRLAYTFLIVVNSAFTTMGVGLIGFSIYKKVTAPPQIADENEANGNKYDGTTTIVAGSFLLGVGPTGLLGVLMKRRVLLIVYTLLLCASLICNVVFVVVISVAAHSLTKMVTDNMFEALTKRYGNNSDKFSKEFEVDINDYQNSKMCCGWSRNSEENIFLKTPWYVQNNVSVVRTLPDSCCMKSGDPCRTATNLKEAREKKFIYPDDCLSIVIRKLKVFLGLTISLLVLFLFLQIGLVAFTVLFLLTDQALEQVSWLSPSP